MWDMKKPIWHEMITNVVVDMCEVFWDLQQWKDWNFSKHICFVHELKQYV